MLVAAFAVAVAGEARLKRSKPTRVYRPNKDALRLLDHVMLHEEQWTDVLQEPIKGLDEPPHKGRKFLGIPELLPIPSARTAEHSTEPVYNVHDIVATVVTHYRAIRSFTEYGAKALRRALACYTFKQVYFQSKTMALMMSKNAEPIVLLTTASDLKKNSSKFVDILSAVPDNDLTLLLDSYWVVIKHLQYEGVQHTDKPPFPQEVIDSMNGLYKKIEVYLLSHCVPYATDEQFLKMIGIPRSTPMIEDPSLRSLISLEELTRVSKEQAEHMARMARRMGNATMTDHLWSSLFLYRGRPRPDSTRLTVEDPNKSEAKPETSEAGASEEPAIRPVTIH